MIAEDIILFDGVAHDLQYSFQKGGQQQLMYDGKVVAQSAYQVPGSSLINGMAVGVPSTVISSSFETVEWR